MLLSPLRRRCWFTRRLWLACGTLAPCLRCSPLELIIVVPTHCIAAILAAVARVSIQTCADWLSVAPLNIGPSPPGPCLPTPWTLHCSRRSTDQMAWLKWLPRSVVNCDCIRPKKSRREFKVIPTQRTDGAGAASAVAVAGAAAAGGAAAPAAAVVCGCDEDCKAILRLQPLAFRARGSEGTVEQLHELGVSRPAWLGWRADIMRVVLSPARARLG